mmetsp:Transcript_13201/g.32020  ORF Transcript_13201/g.32020 Transcript_13201/m.32020 type:complete len:261 (-) Transcript_13201:80-862(-)
MAASTLKAPSHSARHRTSNIPGSGEKARSVSYVKFNSERLTSGFQHFMSSLYCAAPRASCTWDVYTTSGATSVGSTRKSCVLSAARRVLVARSCALRPVVSDAASRCVLCGTIDDSSAEARVPPSVRGCRGGPRPRRVEGRGGSLCVRSAEGAVRLPRVAFVRTAANAVATAADARTLGDVVLGVRLPPPRRRRRDGWPDCDVCVALPNGAAAGRLSAGDRPPLRIVAAVVELSYCRESNTSRSLPFAIEGAWTRRTTSA